MSIVDSGRCVNCESNLKLVFPESKNQFEDALDLTISPGYGEKLDGFRSVQFFLCSDCADELFKLFPTLKDKVLNEASCPE